MACQTKNLTEKYNNNNVVTSKNISMSDHSIVKSKWKSVTRHSALREKGCHMLLCRSQIWPGLKQS